MASNLRRSDELKELEEAPCRMEMTPMIDVTFLLLIFFMCTLKFKTLDGTLGAYLPKDVGVSMTPAEPLENVVIRIDVIEEGTRLRRARSGETKPYTAQDEQAGLRFEFGADRLVRYRVGPHAGLDRDGALRSLARIQAANSEARFSIDARDGVIQDEVVQVMDGMIELGITRVTFQAPHAE